MSRVVPTSTQARTPCTPSSRAKPSNKLVALLSQSLLGGEQFRGQRWYSVRTFQSRPLTRYQTSIYVVPGAHRVHCATRLLQEKSAEYYSPLSAIECSGAYNHLVSSFNTFIQRLK